MHGSGLDALLKGLIAKAAGIVLLVIAFVLALLCVSLILRKALRNKPLKTKLVTGCLLTPILTFTFAVAIIWLSWFALRYIWIEPENKRRCIQGMQSIAEASRRWASEHDGRLPDDVLSLSNHLASPQLLICPATGRFSSGAYRREEVSYVLTAPGAAAEDTNTMFLRCAVHRLGAYTDGRVANSATQR
jgi:hypothetical protein